MSGIIRVAKDRNYFAASNIPFNDERLSWEARGVIGYLLSKPDNWKIRMSNLEKKGNAGRDRIARIMKELETCGYVTRKKFQHKNGKFDWETTVHEIPTIPVLPVDGSAVNGSAVDGKHVDLISTELISTDLTSTDKEEEATTNYRNKSDLFFNEQAEEAKYTTIYLQVTGNFSMGIAKDKNKAALETIERIHDAKGKSTVDYLKPFFTAWCERGYNRMGFGWLEWAASGHIPPWKKNGKTVQKQDEISADELAEILEGAK